MRVEDNTALHAEIYKAIEDYNITYNELDDLLMAIELYMTKAVDKKEALDKKAEHLEYLTAKVFRGGKQYAEF